MNGAQGLLGKPVTASLTQLGDSKEAELFKGNQTLSLYDHLVLSIKASLVPRTLSVAEQRVSRCWENKEMDGHYFFPYQRRWLPSQG